MLYQKMWRVGIDLGGRIFAEGLLSVRMRRSREAAKSAAHAARRGFCTMKIATSPGGAKEKPRHTLRLIVDIRFTMLPERQKRILMRTYMSRLFFRVRVGIVFLLVAFAVQSYAQSSVGIFENHSDVGTVLHPGSVDYDAAAKTYTISGSGENMWLAADAFQFVWKKMSGDVTLTADISFLTKTGNEHKKAALMLRQSLEADSVYADVALHASGLTSLQFRDEKGAITSEIQSNLSAPKRLRIAKRGDYVYMSLGNGGDVDPAGGWLRIPLQGTFYVGLGVCSHDKDVVEQAVFSNVELTQPAASAAQSVLYSTLETISPNPADRRVEYIAKGRFEAPNWMRDGNAFLFNRDGHIERLAVGRRQAGGDRYRICDALQQRSRHLARCDRTGDQRQLAGRSESQVYIVPIGGGTPRKITKKSPSYWHGWSPDGKTLAFVGPARWRFRHLLDSGGRRLGDAADHGEGAG